MIELITILIGLLGYGQPEDYAQWTEPQLINEIEVVAAEQGVDDGILGDWDSE